MTKCENCGHSEHGRVVCGYGEWAGGANVILCQCKLLVKAKYQLPYPQVTNAYLQGTGNA